MQSYHKKDEYSQQTEVGKVWETKFQEVLATKDVQLAETTRTMEETPRDHLDKCLAMHDWAWTQLNIVVIY